MTKNEIIQTMKDVENDAIEGINRCIFKAIVYILQREKRCTAPLKRNDNFLNSKFTANNDICGSLHLRPSCRFHNFKQRVKNTQKKSVDVILDVAHNVDAIKALREKMSKTFPNAYVRYILGDQLSSFSIVTLRICMHSHVFTRIFF